MAQEQRFEAILDPLDLWIVWDNVEDGPAEFASMALVGMSEDEAQSASVFLNGLYSQLSNPKDHANTSVA